MPDIDPMTPPIVQLSGASDVANVHYFVARLRKTSNLEALRIFLAFFIDRRTFQFLITCSLFLNVFVAPTASTVLNQLRLMQNSLPSDLSRNQRNFYSFRELGTVKTNISPVFFSKNDANRGSPSKILDDSKMFLLTFSH